jgi:MOSC domain-containing protein YiiM
MAAPFRAGKVDWIGLRPARRAAMVEVRAAELSPERGLVGDRYSRAGGPRQVTLIQAESLHTIASHLGLETVSPADLRRNIVTSGINLVALKGRRVRIGAALIEVTEDCHPCSRMEEAFGVGGYNAVRGLGGVTARVLEEGVIGVGDAVVPQSG